MEKVKIKLGQDETDTLMEGLKHFLENVEMGSTYQDQINRTAIVEVKHIVGSMNLKFYPYEHISKNKKVSGSIYNSQALAFFGIFYGYRFPFDYLNIVFKGVCSQIEIQLFKRGPYNLPQKGVNNG